MRACVQPVEERVNCSTAPRARNVNVIAERAHARVSDHTIGEHAIDDVPRLLELGGIQDVPCGFSGDWERYQL